MRVRTTLLHFLLLITLGCSVTEPSHGQDLIVGPYLQRATPESIWIHWVLDGSHDGEVHWSTHETLNNVTYAQKELNSDGYWHYAAHLAELQPNTKYHYLITCEAFMSETFNFKTPPLAEDELPFRLVAMSDMQIDWTRPEQFRSVVNDGVIEYITDFYSPDLAHEIAMIMIPGDLVENGLSYLQWIEDFFVPASHLFSYVPIYPVPGNHENNSPYFFQYFNLPPNGSANFEEHWYFFDYGNLRVIGLDSNGIYRNNIQLDWLIEVLDETCERDEIDFVFAQLHHPHHSELWPEGNINFTGVVIEQLEDFSSRCTKPSVHFFGHTHGYARGHSQDHRHVMVNVASAGGNLDDWGEYPQIDYEEYVVSQAEYGFVLVDVEGGDDPAFEIQRLSMGTAEDPRQPEIRDRLRIRRYNEAPIQPSARGELGQSVNSQCFTLALSPFEDPDNDAHGATQWQVFEDCNDLSTPIIDQWRQRENWYQNIDLQASDDLTDEVIEGLMSNQDYCWRARYRDEGLMWSAWSDLQSFRTNSQHVITYPLNNPDAEQGTTGWTVEAGVFESLTETECNGVYPFEGDRYFAVGGVCNASERAQVSQKVDVSTWQIQIEKQELHVTVEAMARNWNGSDIPELGLTFLDAEGNVLDDENRIQTTEETWTLLRLHHRAPPNTTSAKITLYGTRYAGEDNDSYFDAINAFVTLSASYCDPPPEPDIQAEYVPVDMNMPSLMDGHVLPSESSDMTLPIEADPLLNDASMNRSQIQNDLGHNGVDRLSSDSDDSGCSSHHAHHAHLTMLIALLFIIRIATFDRMKSRS